MRRSRLAALLLLALADCAPRVTRPPVGGVPATAKGAQPAAPARVSLELYVMSKCPYAGDALRAAYAAALLLGDRVQLRVDYIAVAGEDGRPSSMHGAPEVDGDLLQLCAQKLKPAPESYLRFVTCHVRDFAAIPGGWERCAAEAGIDQGALKACWRGEGSSLLQASMGRAQAAGASGSPTIRIGGKDYPGARSPVALLRALCGALSGDPPARCRALPVEPEVVATVLGDRRCRGCATDELVRVLRDRFLPRLKVRALDYGTVEGKRLYQELKLQALPVILLDPAVERSDSYAALGPWLRAVGRYRQLRVPASFDPTAEICDNGVDDNADGKADCADPTCSTAALCRKEIKRRLDVFIMSQCPYAVQGILAMEEVLRTFQGKLTFDLHYIVGEAQGGGYTSMHGEAELAEDQRQLCANKLYRRGDLHLRYLYCRAKAAGDADWRTCATGPIAARKIEECVRKEGAALLRAEHKLTTSLGVDASPTWLANNRHLFNAVTAAEISAQLCKHNPELSPCKSLPPAPPPSSAPAPGGSCGQ